MSDESRRKAVVFAVFFVLGLALILLCGALRDP
jgi:hypothetical protein